ncbi:hypothetical protein [Pedobacter sp.]
MNSFAFLMHHTWNAEPKSRLEIFFSTLKYRINSHIEHIEVTDSLYKKQLSEARQQLEDSFIEPLKIATKRYKELVGDGEVSPSDDQIASHESGLSDLENEHSFQDHELSERFDELGSMFNNSALIQTCSLLEKELKDLCYLLQDEENELISLEDFASRDYIGGCLKYLTLVIKLDNTILEPYLNKIKDLQFLRNRIVHDRGEFLKSDEKLRDNLKIIKEIIKKSSNRVELIEEHRYHELKIKEASYVLDYYKHILEFFQTILWLIENRFNHKLLKSKLIRLIGSTQKKAKIKFVDYKATIGKFEVKYLLTFNGKVVPKQFEVLLEITKRKGAAVYSSYKGPKNDIIEQLSANLREQSFIILNEFHDYVIIRKELGIAIKFVATSS